MTDISQGTCDRGGQPIEVGHRVAMKLTGRPRRVVYGTVRGVRQDSVEIWDGDGGMQMFHSARPDQVRVLDWKSAPRIGRDEPEFSPDSGWPPPTTSQE